MTMETTHVPSTYLAEILHLLQALSEVEERLNSPILQAKDCEDLIKQEECLKVRHKLFSPWLDFIILFIVNLRSPSESSVL